MLELVTPQFDPSAGDVDTRLKLLWIEDQMPSDTARDEQRVRDCFLIYRAYKPDELGRELESERAQVIDLRDRVQFYDFPKFPFDLYLCDFQISKGNVQQLQNESIDDRQQRVMAGKAEAAGLTAGVLTYLAFDRHPAIILPHTAYNDQVGNQCALLRTVAGSFLTLGHRGDERANAKRNFCEMLVVLTRNYRDSMPGWCSQGWIGLSYTEKLRLSSLAREREQSGRVMWCPQDRIRLDTAWQTRWISLQALWFEDLSGKGTGIPIETVEAWIKSFPMPHKAYLAAMSLAEQFFERSRHPHSELRHRLSTLLIKFDKASEIKKPSLRLQIKELSGKLGFPFPQVLDPTFDPELRGEIDVSQKHLIKVDLVTEDGSKPEDVRRLATLMLLVKEEYLRHVLIQREIDEILEPVRAHLSSNAISVGLSARRAFRLDSLLEWEDIPESAAEMLYRLRSYGINEIYWEEGEIHLPPVPSVEPQDLHRRIDPFPENLRTRWESINREIKRDGLNLVNLLSGSHDAGMRPEEKRELQRYAGEIGYPRSLWPLWLRD